MSINYIEKGRFLHDAIRNSGHSLWQENGVWVSSNDEAVQLLIDNFTLDQAKSAKKLEVSKFATALRNKVVADYSPGEMASWSLKLSEAVKYLAGDTNCPMLTMEANFRGVSLESLVNRVMENAALFSGAEALIAGVEGSHRDNIDLLTTFEEVNSYDFTANWPEV